MNTYANDLRCHNAEPGSFNHECGQPAVWLGIKPNGFQSGFCDECKQHGWEATACCKWQRLPDAA